MTGARASTRRLAIARLRAPGRLAAPAIDAFAAAGVALAVFAFVGHAYLDYDAWYALLWGSDLADGQPPRYDGQLAPTPHPLLIAVAALLAPLGEAADDLLLAGVLLALGALCVGLFRLGQTLYAWPVGLLAAAILATRVPILSFGVRGYVEFPTLALIVWAAVLDARRPRRGAPVLVLLALAGLLRPEAWLLAVAYWLWLAPPLPWAGRARLLALAAAAPLVWGLSDLAVTGDPLWSLHGTRQLAGVLDRPTGLAEVPEILPRRLGEIMRLPGLVAAVLGLAAGLAWLRRATLLPLALAALNVAAFAAFAAAGLSLLGRYLFLAAAMLALFAALAALGWRALPPEHRARPRWRAGGLALLAALLVAYPIGQADSAADLRADLARLDRVHSDLHDLVARPPVAALLDRCGRLFTPTTHHIPALASWTGRRPETIASLHVERPTPAGALLALTSREVEQELLRDLDERPRGPVEVPPGYRTVARNRSWVAFARCGRAAAGARRGDWTVHPSSRRAPGRSRRLRAPARLPRGAWTASLKAASSRT